MTDTATAGAATGISAQLASGSWSGGGAGAYQVSFADPGGSVVRIVSWALEYVHPLDQWLDALVGDKAQVAAYAQTWNGVAATLRGAQEEVGNATTRIHDQQGHTARAIRKRLDDIRGALTDAGEWSAAAATALQLASTIVTAVHDAVVGALSELAGLVVDLFGFTLNPFDKVDDLKKLVQRAGEFIHVIGQLIERMTTALVQLKNLLEALLPVIADILERLRPILAAMVRLAGAYSGPLGAVLGGAAGDFVKPDPRVTELDPDDLTDPDARKAFEKADGVTEITSLADAVSQNGLTDSMGGDQRTVIDIKQIRSADGQLRWVVSLPSTQDWDFPGMPDKPAANDLDGNVALIAMNNPAFRTQYERAVMQAMDDAGVPRDAHVVYTGFSQGGIMAASIASHDTTHHTDAIITNGSPIGTFPIPLSTRVVSFEHQDDIVPLLDGQRNDVGDLLPNRTNVRLPDPPQGSLPTQTHNNANYAQSVADWQGTPDASAADDVAAMVTGTVIDHQFHTFGEGPG